MSLENELKELNVGVRGMVEALLELTKVQKAFLEGMVEAKEEPKKTPAKKREPTPKADSEVQSDNTVKETSKPKVTTPEPKVTAPIEAGEGREATADDVRAALRKLMEKVSMEFAMEQLATYGNSPSVGELKAEKYQAVIDRCQEVLNGK